MAFSLFFLFDGQRGAMGVPGLGVDIYYLPDRWIFGCWLHLQIGYIAYRGVKEEWIDRNRI